MTVEQKAKAYDKALERAKKEWSNNLDGAYKNYRERLEFIFPELKNNKKEWIEKIRQELKSYLEHRKIEQISESDAIDQWIVWLEKQGEKSVDNVVSKFNVGDWLVQNERRNIVKVVSYSHFDYEVVDTLGYHHKITSDAVENNYHLWSIKDARDGDILAGSKDEVILMFRGIGNTEWDDVIDYHCYYDCYRKEFIVQEKLGFWGNVDDTVLKPATKEQRDLLLQKMKEAGYEWDSKKKELYGYE